MLKEQFLVESVEGTLWVLNKFFPENQEVMQIFEGMSKDQMYAVSCLLEEVRKSSNADGEALAAEEKYFYIVNTSDKYGSEKLGNFEIITIRFGNQRFRSALKPLGGIIECSKYNAFKSFVEEALKFACPYVDSDDEGAMRISLQEAKEKIPAPLLGQVMKEFAS